MANGARPRTLQAPENDAALRGLPAVEDPSRRLFEAAPIGFVRVSITDQIEDINAAARQLLGIAEGWSGHPSISFTSLLSDGSRAIWDQLTQGSGGASPISLVASGRPFTAEVRAIPWRGSGDGWLVVIVDGSALSEARALQLEAEERFAQVVRQMSDGLVVVDGKTGLIEDHNESFARMLGCSGASLAGQAHGDLFVPAWAEEQRVALRQALREGSHALVRYAHADGSERVGDVTAGSVEACGAGLEYLVVRDVTARVHAEDERRRVEARIAETQKLEALGLLAAGVAHDMNNLLTTVLAATEVPPTPETISELRAAALRGRELTERLLAVSRRKPLRSRAFDLLDVVDEVVALARSTFPREIEVSFQRPQGTWLVEGDPGQWHQALLNLLINARDAITGAGEIAVSTEVSGGARALLVRDDGAGMSAEVLRRAFEPFFSTKTPGQGTGLGLAHVRAVVAAHGGTVAIDSAPGVGTTVRLEIEQRPPARRAPSVPPPRAGVEAAKEQSVLVVDDEPFVGRAVGRLLQRKGWAVVGVSSVPEAVKQLEARRFDLVLTDRSMPRMTGDQLCRAVRCRWPDMKVAVMTGLADDQNVLALEASGADSVLSKPFSSEELSGMLDDVGREREEDIDVASCELPESVVSCAASCPRRRPSR